MLIKIIISFRKVFAQVSNPLAGLVPAPPKVTLPSQKGSVLGTLESFLSSQLSPIEAAHC